MARPSKYPPEFRARAVALVLDTGRPNWKVPMMSTKLPGRIRPPTPVSSETVIATVHFDTVEDAHAWIDKNLGVQL